MKKKRITNLVIAGAFLAFLAPNVLNTSVYADTGIAIQSDSISLNETYTDSISYVGEEKEVIFTTTSEDSFYTMTAKNISIKGYGFYAEVYDSFENLVWKAANLYNDRSEQVSMKLKQNETYTVKFYATNKLTGNFSFAIEEIVDDRPDSKAEALPFSIGETVEYTLEADNDVEWFKFTTSDQYSYYEITSKNVSIPGYGYYFEIYDYEDEQVIKHANLSEHKEETGYYKLDPGTTYYVKCYASNHLTGNYSFNINEITDDSFDEKVSAKKIELNTEYTRKLETKDDVDFFQFKSKIEGTYTFTFKNLSNESYGQYAYIYSETNEQVCKIENIPGGRESTAKAELKPNTAYYVKVYCKNGSKGFYRFSVKDGTTNQLQQNDDMSPIVLNTQHIVNPTVEKEKELGESVVYGGSSMANASRINLDHISYGQILASGENYWYKFTTSDRDSYYDITAKNVSIYDYGWYAELVDENMNIIWDALNIYGNNNSWTQIKLQPNTTYYFKCYTKNTKEIGVYSLAIKEIEDDLGDTAATAKEIAFGERVVQCIESINDQDWFKFTTTSEDNFYKIYSKNLSMKHNDSSYGHYFEVYLGEDEVVSHGNISTYNDSCTYIKLEPNTTYTIKSYAKNKLRGNYEIQIDMILDDAPDTQEQAQELKTNIIYDRKLNAKGDVDYFSFQVEESGTYTFYTKSLSVPSYGIYTELTDPYGDKLAECKNLSEHAVVTKEVNLTAGRTYYVKAYVKNSSTGDYRFYLTNGTPKDEFPANPFIDIKEADYFYKPVLWATQENITAGVAPGYFGPGYDCTRSQVVTFLWRLMGRPEPTITTSTFKDVPSNAYYYKAVLWAVELGITSGYNAETFGSEDMVTRSQFVTFLWRLNQKPNPANVQSAFVDIPSNAYYYKAVLWAVEKGITAGYYQNYFAPDLSCTRGQVVSFLYRAENNK